MCVTSAVMDQWNPYIPQPNKIWPQPQTVPYTQPYNIPPNQQITIWPQPQVAGGVDNGTVKELIDSLRQALEAAEKLDELTNQPDCVDPEKAKLMERVAILEARLDEIDTAS